MKKILFFLLAGATSIALLPSCKKGDVKASRLDGTWKLASGTGTSSTAVTDKSTNVTTTSTSTSRWDGSTLSTTTVNAGVSLTTTNPYTVEWTFDKSDDTYSAKSVSVEEWESLFFGYTTSNCDFASSVTLDRKVKYTLTANSSGNYTILGATGDVEKNSRFMLQSNSNSYQEVKTYTYFDGTVQITSPLYTMSASGCLPASTTETISSSDNDVADEGQIITVEEMDKEMMKVVSKNVNTNDGVDEKIVYTSESTLEFKKN